MSFDPKDTAEYATGAEFASRFFVAHGPPVEVSFGAASHRGLVRPNNEDHFSVIRRTWGQSVLLTNVPDLTLTGGTGEAYLFVVADGMGGAAAGEFASRLVLQQVCEVAAQASSWIMRFSDLSAQQVRERTDAYAARLQQALIEHAEANQELAGMGTTLTSAYVVGWDALIAHIGDSRAYLFSAGELRRVTRDHTLAQELIDRGVPPEQTKKMRHILTNSLASDDKPVETEIHHVALTGGDRLLLCTDGLTDLVSDQEIAEAQQRRESPQATCDDLVGLALARGGTDNVTVVIAEFSGRHSEPNTGYN